MDLFTEYNIDRTSQEYAYWHALALPHLQKQAEAAGLTVMRWRHAVIRRMNIENDYTHTVTNSLNRYVYRLKTYLPSSGYGEKKVWNLRCKDEGPLRLRAFEKIEFKRAGWKLRDQQKAAGKTNADHAYSADEIVFGIDVMWGAILTQFDSYPIAKHTAQVTRIA